MESRFTHRKRVPGVVKAVRAGLVPPGGTVVTILCDSGARHLSKFWSPGYLRAHGLLPDFLDADGHLLVRLGRDNGAVYIMVRVYNGAQLNGAPFNGAPLNGAVYIMAYHLMVRYI